MPIGCRTVLGLVFSLLAASACGEDSGSNGAGGDTPGGGGNAQGSGGGPSGPGAGGGGGGGVVPTMCDDDCHYVHAAASGDGSGSDWGNAFPALPDELLRGHAYFLGPGSYPAYTFDDAESGTQTIRVLRATEVDHGTGKGWSTALAEGTAEFGPLVFSAPRFELDGRDALRVVGTFESTVVEIGASNVVFRGCDVDGDFQETAGKHTGGACTGMNITGDSVVVANNRIHDAADDGVAVTSSQDFSFVGNVVHALHGCGTDGECGPCYNGHSDGLEIYDVKQSQFVGNLVYDVASTSTFFFGNWADDLGNGPSEYCEDILLANNLLYAPGTGFVAYIEDARGVFAYANVFWGRHQGAYGGLSIGQNVTGLELYNNAILSLNYTHIGGSYDAAEHHGDYNLFGISLGQWEDQAHDVFASDPSFAGIPGMDDEPATNPEPSDFAPKAGSPLIGAGYGGDEAIAIPAKDFFGKPRGPKPNIGAIE